MSLHVNGAYSRIHKGGIHKEGKHKSVKQVNTQTQRRPYPSRERSGITRCQARQAGSAAATTARCRKITLMAGVISLNATLSPFASQTSEQTTVHRPRCRYVPGRCPQWRNQPNNEGTRQSRVRQHDARYNKRVAIVYSTTVVTCT
jgi:hypothetical protein